MTSKTTNLRKVEGDIYVRGRSGMHYIRKRIPAALRLVYPDHKTHVTRSLHTNDIGVARRTSALVLAEIQDEFERSRDRLDLARASKAPVRITKLNERQLSAVLGFWLHGALAADDERRTHGMEDDEFEELEAELKALRGEYGRMLAKGHVMPFLAPLSQFLYLCGMNYVPSEEEGRRVSLAFLMAVVKALDVRLRRMTGDLVPTDDVAPVVPHPLYVVAPGRVPRSPSAVTWDSVFEAWRGQVKDRPKSTTNANRTAWRDLVAFDLPPSAVPVFWKESGLKVT